MDNPNISYGDLTIVIPVKNESDNIGGVIEELLRLYPGLHIIVSDDGSTDGTVELIKNNQKYDKSLLLRDRKNERIKGLTVSVLDAIEMVKTAYFIVMDGDGQHEPGYVRLIYEQLKLNNKLCVASRIAVPGWPFMRKISSRIGTYLGKTILFLKRKKIPKDILSGFFGAQTGYWREVAGGKKDCFSLRGYKILFDFLKICDSAIDIKNVNYIFNARSTGSSKIHWKIYMEYLKSLLQ